MTAPKPRPRQSRQLDAGGLQPEISSFRLHLAAEGKAAKTGPQRCGPGAEQGIDQVFTVLAGSVADR
jgi:hypothetical protein